MSKFFELDVPVSDSDHAIGPPRAALTVVEYGDFECPNCKQAAPAVRLLRNRFKEQVRFVFRHFPLEEVHPHALQAAEAAESAGAQSRFWPMHELLFENQAHLEPHHLHTYAESLQLDLTRYRADIEDRVYLRRVREHIAGGNREAVFAAPRPFS